MKKILSLNEFSYMHELQKRRLENSYDDMDYGSFLAYRFRIGKHLLRGLMNLHLKDSVFHWSLQREGIDLKNYKLIIVNELNQDPLPFIRYIRQQNPDCHIVYQYWNSLFYMENPGEKRRQAFDRFVNSREQYQFHITSFDIQDCQRYNFIYNPQFIPGLNYSAVDQQALIETDVFFIGKDKDRLARILTIKKQLEALQITSQICVLPDNRHKIYNQEEKEYLLSHEVPYDKIIEKDRKSKAILDVVQPNQAGLTWRAVEALLLRKKLITTFKDVKQYDFYCKENVFIWGEDDIRTLKTFIDSPYKVIDKDIVEQYTFAGWLKNLKQHLS